MFSTTVGQTLLNDNPGSKLYWVGQCLWLAINWSILALTVCEFGAFFFVSSQYVN